MRFLIVILYGLLSILNLGAQLASPTDYPKDTNTVSILYTGRSLGALGVLRSQEEHELLTEQANTDSLQFKLVSHACWRAPGLVVFLPSDEPRGSELARILAKKDSAIKITHYKALKTPNALLLQDPRLRLPDMLAMIRRNPRQQIDFPDMIGIEITIYSMTIRDGDQAFIIEEAGALWPSDPDLWTKGEFNRIDIGDIGRLFELPVNLGEMAVRATVLRNELQRLPPHSPAILVDLGQRTGNFGMNENQRARIDYTVLNQLGYTITVPYHFELALGADSLKQLSRNFPRIRFLATNLNAKDSSLFYRHIIESYHQLKLGFIGLVDPSLQGDLAKSSLKDFRFVSTMDAVKSEVLLLRKAGVNVIIALSNMDPGENAAMAEQIAGIDIIAADLHTRWHPETLIQTVQLSPGGQNKRGSPSLVTRSFANGLGVGVLRLEFNSTHQLYKIQHQLVSVTDHTLMDTAIHKKILAMTDRVKKPRGELMFPAFIDLVSRNPELNKFDQVTKQGRVSQQMWEEFVARLLRQAGPAELAIMRKFPYFPPLIGKLHEEEINSWLWTEEDIVLCDIKGSALLKILADDVKMELIISGLTRPTPSQYTTYSAGLPSLSTAWYQFNTRVMGRFIDPEAFYRVATTDVIFEGIRATDFLESRRVRREFTVDQDGRLIPNPGGATLPLRTFVLDELKRIRSTNKGEKKYLDAISDRLKPDPKFERLLTFDF